MALSTLAALKTHLVISDTNRDTILTQILAEVDKLVKEYVQDAIEASDYTDDYDGNGQDELILRHRPLNSITSIKEDYFRAFGSATVLDTSLYTAELSSERPDNPSIVKFIYYALPNGKRNVRVAYNAGYTTVPADVVLAVHKWAGAIWNRRRDEGIVSQSLGNNSFTYEAGDMPADVAAILDRYKSRIAA